uniref:Uncharacterized protein n=2 Tax=Anopheles atroparvus TaxID=41427 RepID=A0AAG5DRJ6_ANOAO
MSQIFGKTKNEGLGLKTFRMRKKFVQTLAARQLEYGEDSRTNEEMDSEKQPSSELQQQADNSAEEIIEILDDDQEVELMMERHRKYHPRKYVNLQHPPSKIYYDKIDKVVSPVGDKEDQEDEDERNQLVIEESSPKELNNNSISVANLGSSNVGGSLDDSVLSLRSSVPRNEEEAYLLQEYHYRRLYGGYGGHIPVNVAPDGQPSSRDQQETHQQSLKSKSSQRSLDPPGPLMGPLTYAHPPPYERSHPYGQRPVSYDRNVPAPQTPYYRRKDARRMSLHERPRASHAELNGAFLVPEPRTEFAKTGGNRNSAFSPPRDMGHNTTRVSEANKTRAHRPPAPPAATVASAIVTPRTPTYYPQPRSYDQSGISGAHRSREANSYLALAEWYRTGVPPLHMITASDLQSMCYYTYYMDKMAAASSVYHHAYRDHTLSATNTTVAPGIGAIGSVQPGSVSAVALGSPSYPPPQYGFARSPTEQAALYSAQQQPFDYTVYQNVLAQSGYMPTPTCQSQTAITSSSIVPSSFATSSSTSASEIMRPTVINRVPIPTTVPQNVPRTVPVNLVHPSVPPVAPAAPAETTVEMVAYPSVTSSRSEHGPTILKPLLARPLVVTEEEDEKNKRPGDDAGRMVVVNFATASNGSVPSSSEKSKPSETVAPTSSPSVPSKPIPPSTSPKGDNIASKTVAAPNPPAAHTIPLTMAMPTSRPRGRPPGAKNKESSATARAARATVSATDVIRNASASAAATGVKGSNQQVVERLSSSTIKVRVDRMKQEVDCFLNRRRTEVITTMRLYSIGRIDFDGLLQEMKRHSIVYRDFLSVAYELISNARLTGFVREPPAELDYRWKSPPQEFADYFAKNEQCSRTFVRENFDFLSLIVDNLLKQYYDPLEYFLLTYVLGLRMK